MTGAWVGTWRAINGDIVWIQAWMGTSGNTDMSGDIRGHRHGWGHGVNFQAMWGSMGMSESRVLGWGCGVLCHGN